MFVTTMYTTPKEGSIFANEVFLNSTRQDGKSAATARPTRRATSHELSDHVHDLFPDSKYYVKFYGSSATADSFICY